MGSHLEPLGIFFRFFEHVSFEVDFGVTWFGFVLIQQKGQDPAKYSYMSHSAAVLVMLGYPCRV